MLGTLRSECYLGDMLAAPPPSDVLTAFSISDPAIRLSGGQGHAFRAGNWVLKPAPHRLETEWIAEAVEQLDQVGFRVARHKRAGSGAWVVSGWSAQQRLEGEPRAAAWPEIISAGQTFHRALADVPRPDFLDQRRDPWAVADRFAWGEGSHDEYPGLADALAPLIDRLRPVQSRDQLIHGDLTSNVMFHDGQPPAIIDITLYWRPSTFAAAVVVADALTWEGADLGLLASVESLPEIDQMLFRAAIWRLLDLKSLRQQPGADFARAMTRHRKTQLLLFRAFPG